MSPRTTTLLYSPDLDGHRQVYCERVARVLLERGHHVCLAAAFRAADGSPFLDDFANLLKEPCVSRVDVSCFPSRGTGIDAVQLAGLVARTGAQVTVLLEADDLLQALCGQIGHRGTRLPGRRVGLFIRSTNYQYPQGPQPLRRRLGWLRRLPAEWSVWPRLFHEYLLPRYALLDAALCLDEYFVAGHRRSHRWMPDMYETSRQACGPQGAAGAGSSRLRGPDLSSLDAFVGAHAAREIFVYFGTASARRGYDILLRLAERRGACFVHCGRRNDADVYAWNVARLRSGLERRRDLFETDAFVARFEGVGSVLAVAPAIVLPYRHHLGSSGVMLQTLAAGRPVLVPDVGLVARRVCNHRLGAVYDPSDDEDLDRRVDNMWARLPGESASSIRTFLSYFSPSQVEAAIVAAVEGAPMSRGRPSGAVSPAHLTASSPTEAAVAE